MDSEAPHGFGQLIVRESTTGKEHYVEEVRVKKGLNGPILKSIIVRGRAYGCPLVVREITLYSKVKKIDFYYRVLKDSTPMLEVYIAFPFKMHNPSFKYEGPNIVVTPIEDQFPVLTRATIPYSTGSTCTMIKDLELRGPLWMLT